MLFFIARKVTRFVPSSTRALSAPKYTIMTGDLMCLVPCVPKVSHVGQIDPIDQIDQIDPILPL